MEAGLFSGVPDIALAAIVASGAYFWKSWRERAARQKQEVLDALLEFHEYAWNLWIAAMTHKKSDRVTSLYISFLKSELRA